MLSCTVSNLVFSNCKRWKATKSELGQYRALQDPLADGPTIQAASTRALDKGLCLSDVIDMVREVSPSIKAPLLMFTYYNPIMARGLDKFCKDIKAAGVAGKCARAC